MARIKRLNVPGTGSATNRTKDDYEREEEEEEHREREGERAVHPRLDSAAPAAPPSLPQPPAQPPVMTQAIDAEDEITIPQQLVRQELLEHQHQQLGNSMGPPQTVPAGEPLQVRIANGQEDGHHDMETDPGADVVPSRPLSRSGNINDGSSTTISHEPEVAPPHSASLLLQPSLPYLPDHSPTNNENSQNSTQKNTHVEPRVTPAAVTSTPALPSSPSSPSTLTSYSVGMYLEVQDKVQKWCEAEVIGINTSLKTLRITYLYWGDKYDEDIPFFSSRLAPFPTHTYQPGQPHTLQVGQRIEVEDLEKEVGKRWGEAEVKALEEKDEKREGGRLGMVLVSWKRPKEKERVEQWLPMDSSRLRAYGRMKTSTLEKKRLNRAAAAAAAVAATRTRAATTGATATGGSKRMPLRAIDDTNHHQLNVRKNKTCINLSEPHLRSIAASSDRYSAYEQGLRRQGLAIQPIEGDGNCLFRSVSHQVRLSHPPSLPLYFSTLLIRPPAHPSCLAACLTPRCTAQKNTTC